MKIALCQTVTLDGDQDGNLTRIENALDEAARSGATLACFPEAAVLGWANPDAHERAAPIPGETSRRFARFAREYETMVCVGLAERSDAGLHNACLLLDTDGRIVCKHRKMNVLPEVMDLPYTPGDSVTVAETDLGTIGILICADTFESAILERMSECDPDLVLVPYGWAAPEAEWPDHGESLERTVKAAATTVGAPVVGTDLVGQMTNGPWAGRVFGGQSLAVDSHGEVLAMLSDRDREVRIVDIDL